MIEKNLLDLIESAPMPALIAYAWRAVYAELQSLERLAEESGLSVARERKAMSTLRHSADAFVDGRANLVDFKQSRSALVDLIAAFEGMPPRRLYGSIWAVYGAILDWKIVGNEDDARKAVSDLTKKTIDGGLSIPKHVIVVMLEDFLRRYIAEGKEPRGFLQ